MFPMGGSSNLNRGQFGGSMGKLGGTNMPNTPGSAGKGFTNMPKNPSFSGRMTNMGSKPSPIRSSFGKM